jgi:hypothetical protein
MSWQPGGWAPGGWQPPGWQPGGGGESPALNATITLSTALTVERIQAGNEQIIVTLLADTWGAEGATFDAQRQFLIDMLLSQQSETTGWNAEVRAKEVVGAVVRTTDVVVTITLTAAPAYDVEFAETIGPVLIPATAVVGGVSVQAGSFEVGLTQPVLPIVKPSYRSIDAKSISDVYNQGQPLEADYEYSNGRRFYQ